MPFYEMLPGGGMPAGLQAGMDSVLNKKWETSTTYPPEDWPGTVELMGPLEEKTVSGSIIAFPDGADDVPLKSCAVTIASTLDGVSSVDVVKTGKNLLNDSLRGANGANIYFGHDTGVQGDFSVRLKAGTYTYSVVTADGNVTNLYIWDIDNNANVSGFPAYNTLSKTFTLTKDTNCAVWVYKSGYSSVSDIISAQIEAGSTATAYAPYVTPTTHTATLGRTIYGGTADVVNGTGTETWRKIIIDGDTVKCNGIYGANGNALPRLIMDADYYHSGVATDILSTYLTPSSSVINDEDSIALVSSGTSIAVHIGTIQGNDGTHGYNSSAELLAAANAYLQSHNLTVVYKLSDANATDFTFTAVPIISRLGDNTLWSDDGDLNVVYRSSGTQTLIPPTLISKTITANGTYSAEDDDADGYDEVTVNVSGGAQNIETVLSENPLIEETGVSGTDVVRTMWTYTASASGTIKFHADTAVRTNTGNNDGYITVLKNNSEILSTYATTNTTTAFPVPDIDFENGDVITIVCGFDNYHTSAWFRLYSTILILTDS